MLTDQRKSIVRDSGNGEVAEPSLCVDTNRVAQPKSPVPKKLLVVVAFLVVVTLVGWVVYHRSHSDTTTSAGAAAARGHSLPVPVGEGVVSTKDVPAYLEGLGT